MMPTAGAAIRIEAPAKINLYLHVTGRRPDGYHLLDSLVVFGGGGDRIAVRDAPALTLEVDGPFAAEVPTGSGNLVLRAATALAERCGVPARAAIHLEKRLPVASGIGGGSADAAATLHALVALWRIDIAESDFYALAARLGADVPMCLRSRPSFVGGVGEELDAGPPLPAFGIVLANPRIALPTPQVFAKRTGAFSPPARFAEGFTSLPDFAATLAQRRNDLTDAAVALVPAVADVLAALTALPGVHLARMSGSGATCFGVCDDGDAAAEAAVALTRRFPGWWTAAGSVAATGDCD